MLLKRDELSAKNEQKCIELALKTRLNALSSELRAYSIWQTDIPNIYKDLTINFSEVEWKPSLKGKLFQVSVLPFIFLLKWVLVLTIPIFYVILVGERFRERKKLKNRIKDFENALSASDFETPEEKTIYRLWRCCGPGRNFSKDVQFRLLSEWIDLLYGPEIRQRFDFEQMSAEISKRQAQANAPYYRGEPDAAHYHFVDISWSLASDISEKLPPYNSH